MFRRSAFKLGVLLPMALVGLLAFPQRSAAVELSTSCLQKLGSLELSASWPFFRESAPDLIPFENLDMALARYSSAHTALVEDLVPLNSEFSKRVYAASYTHLETGRIPEEFRRWQQEQFRNYILPDTEQIFRLLHKPGAEPALRAAIANAHRFSSTQSSTFIGAGLGDRAIRGIYRAANFMVKHLYPKTEISPSDLYNALEIASYLFASVEVKDGALKLTDTVYEPVMIPDERSGASAPVEESFVDALLELERQGTLIVLAMGPTEIEEFNATAFHRRAIFGFFKEPELWFDGRRNPSSPHFSLEHDRAHALQQETLPLTKYVPVKQSLAAHLVFAQAGDLFLDRVFQKARILGYTDAQVRALHLEIFATSHEERGLLTNFVVTRGNYGGMARVFETSFGSKAQILRILNRSSDLKDMGKEHLEITMEDLLLAKDLISRELRNLSKNYDRGLNRIYSGILGSALNNVKRDSSIFGVRP